MRRRKRRITESRLRHIIREEASRILAEDDGPWVLLVTTGMDFGYWAGRNLDLLADDKQDALTFDNLSKAEDFADELRMRGAKYVDVNPLGGRYDVSESRISDRLIPQLLRDGFDNSEIYDLVKKALASSTSQERAERFEREVEGYGDYPNNLYYAVSEIDDLDGREAKRFASTIRRMS